MPEHPRHPPDPPCIAVCGGQTRTLTQTLALILTLTLTCPNPEATNLNLVHMSGFDGTNVEDLTRAEMEVGG